MKFVLKKMFPLLCAFLMLLPLATSCGNQNPSQEHSDTTGNGQTTGSGDSDEEVENLPQVDYEGKDIRILMRDNDYYYHDMEVEDDLINSQKANGVEEQVYFRNRAVEKRLGVTLKMDRQTGFGNTLDSAKTRVALQDGTYDLIADHGRSLFTYVVEGSFRNWYGLPWVDLSKSWWSQGMISGFSIGENLWCMTGDLSYQGIGATVAMIMNNRVSRDLVLNDPYDAVESGDWTLEVFREMAEMAKATTIEGTPDPANGDRMGYMTSQWRGPMTALYSTGQRTVRQDDDGKLQISVNSPTTITLFDDYFSLLSQEYCKLYLGDFDANNYKYFASGNVLFMDIRLYDIDKIIQNGLLDYSILPWPKYQSDVDEYYAWVDAVANVFAVPNGKTDAEYECIGAVLEALSAEGHRRVIPEFYEITIQKKYAQDPKSYMALDLIRAGRVFDIGSFMMNDLGDLSCIGYTIAGTKTQNYSDWWNVNKDALQGKLEKVNAKFAELLGN